MRERRWGWRRWLVLATVGVLGVLAAMLLFSGFGPVPDPLEPVRVWATTVVEGLR